MRITDNRVISARSWLIDDRATYGQNHRYCREAPYPGITELVYGLHHSPPGLFKAVMGARSLKMPTQTHFAEKAQQDADCRCTE